MKGFRFRKKVGLFAALLLMFSLSGCAGRDGKDGTEDSWTSAAGTNGTERTEETVKPAGDSTEETTGNAEEIKGQDGEFPALSELRMDPSEYPVVDGSTATIPLSAALYSLLTGASEEEAKAAVYHTTTGTAYERLMQGEADLLLVYEGSEDLMELVKKAGVQLQPIGKDALIFMTNTENPVESLTGNELVKIYSGQITNWSQVGGADKEIQAFQRPAGSSGSQALMQKLVMGNVPLEEGENVIRFETMSDILEGMLAYNNEANTLGYSVYYYADSMYSLPGLRFMKVNQVEPSVKTISEESYPYVQDFYAAIRKDEPEDSKAGMIYRWLGGNDGQKLIQDCGYVPVVMQEETVGDVKQEEPLVGYRLGEGQYLAAFSPVYTEWDMEMGTVILFDETMKPVKEFVNAYTEDVGVHEKDDSITIGIAGKTEDGYELQYGVYQPDTQEFLIEPKYTSIQTLDAEKGFYMCGLNYSDRIILDAEQNVLLDNVICDELYCLTKVGDYYWQFTPQNADYSGPNIYRVFDNNLKLLKEYAESDVQDATMDPSGKVLMTERMLQEKYGRDGSLVYQFYMKFGTEEDRMDVILFQASGKVMAISWDNQLLKEFDAEEYEEQQIQCYADFWSKADGENRVYYTYGDQPVAAPDGSPYQYMNKWGNCYYFGKISDNRYEIDRYRTEGGTLVPEGKEYNLIFDGTFDSLEVIGEELFLLQAIQHSAASPGTSIGTKSILYSGSRKLSEIDGRAHCYTGDWKDGDVLVVKNGYEKDSEFLLVRDGAVTYRSGAREELLWGSGELFGILRGNYFVICTTDGGIVYRELARGMEYD